MTCWKSEAVMRNGRTSNNGLLISPHARLSNAGNGEDFAAARVATQELRDTINQYRHD